MQNYKHTCVYSCICVCVCVRVCVSMCAATQTIQRAIGGMRGGVAGQQTSVQSSFRYSFVLCRYPPVLHCGALCCSVLQRVAPAPVLTRAYTLYFAISHACGCSLAFSSRVVTSTHVSSLDTIEHKKNGKPSANQKIQYLNDYFDLHAVKQGPIIHMCDATFELHELSHLDVRHDSIIHVS